MAAISGSLGLLFPMFGTDYDEHPVFSTTFAGATHLTQIPAGLFSSITTPAQGMFTSTFNDCTGLQSIPATLFSGITTGANYMFVHTFKNCTNLSGYIPPTTFAGLIANDSTKNTNMWYDTFGNTQVATSCQAGTVQYITGYEGSGDAKWNGKVSCECDVGYYGTITSGASTCTACSNKPTNSSYTASATTNNCPWECNYGYVNENGACSTCSSGSHFEAAVPNLTTVIGTVWTDGYTSNNGNGADYDTDDMSNSIISGDPLAFALHYIDKGTIVGHGGCSTESGTYGDTDPSAYTVSATLPDSSGQYCWCQLNSYTPDGGSAIPLSTPWVFDGEAGYAEDCARDCAVNCVYALGGAYSSALAFRAAMFNTVTPAPASCAANAISIIWSGATAEDIAANDAATVLYGGDIRTPRAAIPEIGMRFKGWKFQKPAQSGN